MINFANVIELSRHIEILLLSNDCVVVPGLGGFVAHHVEARYDVADGLFLPPLRTLGFNPQLTMNDSLLVQSYVECYDISYPEALRRIQQEVEELRLQLDTYGEFELNDIGRLFINNERKMAFTPCEAGILTPDIYGLSSYEMIPIKTQNGIIAKNTEEIDGTNFGKGKKARILAITNDELTGQKMVSISVSALRNAAVTAVILAAFFLIVSPLNNNPKLLQTEQVRSSISFDTFKNNKKEAAPIKAAIPVRAAKSKGTAIKGMPHKNFLSSSANVYETNSYWALVLCSHVAISNANWFCAELAKDGIVANVICNKEGQAKVLYGKYSSKEEAQAALRTMRSNPHFKQAWALEINNND